MAQTYRLDGALFAEMLKSGAVNLRNNAQTVNELNVFPIPDGDTGENMARTIEGGIAVIGDACADIGEVADSAASGMLLSARGNSGVILSQFFEGVRLGLTGKRSVDLAQFKSALEQGVGKAYSAVVQPTEGTILTVMREACEHTRHIDGEDKSFEAYFAAFIDETYSSLDRTPELLPVLKESGVIDSGGAGFVYLVEGMNRALLGISDTLAAGAHGAEVAASVDSSEFTEKSKMEFGYCTEVIVQLTDSKTDSAAYDVKTLISCLEDMGGESIVAFKTGTRIKVHVHTFAPDRVLAYCLSVGELVAVKVENMSIQHTEAVVRNRFERQTPKKSEQRKKYACVAVADGEGLIEQFRSLGADYVVDGKQTMNPSAQDFISAFDEVNADVIFVLPNNSNIFLTAKQAAELYGKSHIEVINSKTLAEGYSAMSMLDYSHGGTEQIAAMLNEAAASVITGLVTYAVRDCNICGMDIKKGDILGFAGKTLLSRSDDVYKAACELIDKIDKTDKSIIMAVRGKSGEKDTVSRIADYVRERTDLEFYDFDGGQDVYSFIFVIE